MLGCDAGSGSGGREQLVQPAPQVFERLRITQQTRGVVKGVDQALERERELLDVQIRTEVALADRGAGDGLGLEVDVEQGALPGGSAVDDGQADAVAGDGGADGAALRRIAAADAGVQVAAVLKADD